MRDGLHASQAQLSVPSCVRSGAFLFSLEPAMGRNKHLSLIDAPCGQHQELLHSGKELQPSFGSACLERKAIPGQDEGCSGFALVFLSAPVTAGRSCISRCLSTRVTKAPLLMLPFSQTYAQGPHRVLLKPPLAIIPCCDPGSGSWLFRYLTVSYAYCFVHFKRFCCTDVIIVSHQRRTMRHVEGMIPWLSCISGSLFSAPSLLEGYPKQKNDPSAMCSSACNN